MKYSFLYGGSVISQKSRVLIENIDYIEEKDYGTLLIGGTAVEYASIIEKPKRYYRYTTITLPSDY